MMNEPKTPQASDAGAITRRYLDSILIEERLIDAREASLDTEIFGRTYKTPIMMPAFSHLNTFMKEREKAMQAYMTAARDLGALNWVGMCENEEFAEFMEVGVPTVRIVKPYADRDKVFSQIAFAEACGAVAVGMDIDHIFGSDGRCDVVMGEAMTRQTAEDLRAYTAATKLPFVVKGVLSAADAKKCVESGVRGLLVSHHHGRMPFAVPPLMVLPEIVKAVNGAAGVEIFVDCGIDTGADVYKALALGARAAAAGRVLIPPLVKSGAEGVVEQVEKMNAQLRMLMGFTGRAKTSELRPDVLWLDGKRMA